MTRVGARAVKDTFLTNMAIQACNVITGILAARLLQPEGRGELASVILWPAIFAGLGIMGTNWALTREVAAHPEKEADLARTVVVLGLLQAGLFMSLGYWLIPHLLPGDKQHLAGLTRLYLCLYLPLNFITLNLIGLEHGRLRWRRFNLARGSIALPYLIFLLVFWWARVSQVYWFILALLVSNLFTLICCLFMRGLEIFKGRIRLTGALSLLKQGFPFFLASISGVLASQMDKALVVGLLPAELVGYYAVAFTFASAHSSLGGALGVTSFAALANETDPYQQGAYLAKVFRQATWLYVGVGSAVALLAPLLIVPLFGPGFAPAALPAAILALATSLAALGHILNEGLRGRGHTGPGIGAQFLGAGLLALAGWFWVPWLGLKGLAWAVALASLGQFWVLVGAVLVLFPLRPTHLWGLRLRELKLLSNHLGSLWPFNSGPSKG
jgi:O-antigen/teichoic acid export membrane protein